jgi:lipopolysaccharide export system ATP-binding protein
MPLLEARGLVKWYGARKVVDGVSYDVNPGEVVGLLGPNGAGKTTSFRMTTGQITANDGQVLFNGKEITPLPMYRRARLGMGYLSQEPSIFRKLSVEQNLLAILEALPRSRTLGRKLTRSERWERTEEALARFNLLDVRKTTAARCSGGEKRRLEIARCLVCEPLLILLDEPLAAVDPLTKEDIRHNIRELANQGIGILLTDHDVREVLKIADRAYLIINGKVVAHGTPDELKRNKVAIDGYLGDTFAEEGYSRTGSTPVRRTSAFEPEPEDTIVPLSSANGTPFASAPSSAAVTRPAPPPPPSSGSRSAFGGSTQQLLDHEKLRRWVDLLLDRGQMQSAWKELSARGPDAVPVLIEALERREVQLRHLALRLLEAITGESLRFQADGPEDLRWKQIALLRAKLIRS